MSAALTPMREQLAELVRDGAGLEDGGFEAVSLACQTTALAVIDELLRDGHEARIYPSVDGGVHFEWLDEDAPRPASIEFRAHAGAWMIKVDQAGEVESYCLDDPCPICAALDAKGATP